MRRYLTGWFSPIDPQLRVSFYELPTSSDNPFEADIIQQGRVVKTVPGRELGRLQSDVLDTYGGRLSGRQGQLAASA